MRRMSVEDSQFAQNVVGETGELVLSGTAQELLSRRDVLEASYLGEAALD